jgi:hypothetical protein
MSAIAGKPAMSARRWFVWLEDSRGWRRVGPFPEKGWAESFARAQRFAYAYALEAV